MFIQERQYPDGVIASDRGYDRLDLGIGESRVNVPGTEARVLPQESRVAPGRREFLYFQAPTAENFKAALIDSRERRRPAPRGRHYCHRISGLQPSWFSVLHIRIIHNYTKQKDPGETPRS